MCPRQAASWLWDRHSLRIEFRHPLHFPGFRGAGCKQDPLLGLAQQTPEMEGCSPLLCSVGLGILGTLQVSLPTAAHLPPLLGRLPGW